MSSFNLDDAFIPDIDNIEDGKNNNISRNSSIERHLLNKHNIVIPKVKQTTLKFKCIDPWPAKKKSERDEVIVIWIISEQLPFSVVEKFNQRRSNIYKDLQKIPGKVSFTADMSQYVNCKFAISKILYKFNLADKALALTTDNESAMLVCRRILTEEFEQDLNNLSFSHYCCSAHILNLAVKQGMEIID
ncbi:hypothetical protein RhiirC2_794711 [Rhizophagus irregularis]|uniref:Zinc finger bed domain-containing protein ricesleeper 2-like n=1 Tax=Rhizophagus irregularis TaxID=588596 RepID=A0A2N1MD15_9GLOM|nr:hypothetical protein RhiirC2_794711 [Rhizophagus irregularis]